MKTVFYYALTACAVVFSACQNDNSVNPRPTEAIIGKATIKGKVTAELDNTLSGRENAPEGTKVIAEIDTKNLSLNTSGTVYPKKYYEATLTSTGEYTIDVEVGPIGSISVNLYFSDFRADVKTTGTPVSTTFTLSSKTVVVTKGQTKIVDASYN